ncbi:MAG: hypothetical protein H7326_02625 [Bdellovibrionaceae bacterium]|nr:hypothetical protein [Pseudobdellovibrionaceae bacterium]
MMRILNFILVAILVTFGAKASAVCFSTVEEYKKVQSEFPPEFQKYPVYITTDGKLGVAAIEVRDVGDKFKIDAYFRKGYPIDRDDAYIQKLCFVDGKIKIDYEKTKNGKQVKDNFNVAYDGDAKTLKTLFTTFKISNKAEYDRVSTIIAATEKERAEKSSGVQGAQ